MNIVNVGPYNVFYDLECLGSRFAIELIRDMCRTLYNDSRDACKNRRYYK
ncbi:MAG: hypothetical protein QW775_04875 [Ignisphaera sp.]